VNAGPPAPETLPFTKGHGTENDFVLLFDERGELEMSPSLVRALCDRGAGIGADGVLRAVRAGKLKAGASFDPRTWFMDYWNADGTTAEMCGNGARVFMAYLEREAGEDATAGVTIGTRGGPHAVTALGGDRYSVDMGPWRVDTVDGPDVTVRGWAARPATSVNLSNPHAVVASLALEELAAADLSVAPTVLPVPGNGVNVELVVPLSLEGSRGRLRMRVFERGVGETRSCGTGACAAALAARAWAGNEAPDVWDVEVPGGALVVTIEDDRAILEGPAVLVADGVLDLGSIAPPAP
jgi:diaminopimelate epimerase